MKRHAAASAVAILGVLAGAAAHAEWVEWAADARLSARYDSNLNQASVEAEEEGDLSFQPSLGLGRFFQAGERTRLLLLLEAEGDLHGRHESLDAIAGDVEVSLLHKLGLGQDAPWVRPFVRGGYQEVSADQRSGPRFSAGLTLGKRLLPRLEATLHYAYGRRYGEGGRSVVAGASEDVFDQGFHRVALSGDFLLTETLLLSGGVGYRRGDFHSNARDSRFDLLGEVDLEAVAADDVFDGWVYRVEGDGWSPFVRLNQALTRRWSLDVGYRFQYAEGGGLEYRNHVASALVLFRY